MAYGMGDDYSEMSREIKMAKKLIGLAQNEIMNKIMESNKTNEEKLELIAAFLELTKNS